MSTQNEQDIWHKANLVIEQVRDDLLGIDNATYTLLKPLLAPILSRIEWLEAEKHSWKTYAAGLNSRIDALSKDAERLSYLLSKVTMHQAASYGCKFEIINLPAHFGDCEPDAVPPFLKAIDAAISAREGE